MAKQDKKAGPYVAVHGLTFPDGSRAEEGEPCDPPKKSVEWLLEQGHIVVNAPPAEVGAPDAPTEDTAPAEAPAEDAAPETPAAPAEDVAPVGAAENAAPDAATAEEAKA